MLAWERAREWWTANRSSGIPFSDVLANYIREGHYVWSSPKEFILAAQVRYEPGWGIAGNVAPNAWFLHLAATSEGTGLDPFVFMRLAPEPMEWIVYHRRGRLRAHRWVQFAGRQPTLPVPHGKHR